jgi:hypothetical protein
MGVVDTLVAIKMQFHLTNFDHLNLEKVTNFLATIDKISRFVSRLTDSIRGLINGFNLSGMASIPTTALN